MLDMDPEVDVYSGTINTTWTVPANTYMSRSIGNLVAGDEVHVTARTSDPSADLHMGIRYNSNERYVELTKTTTHIITINVNAGYRFFLENLTDQDIDVQIAELDFSY